MPEDDVATGPLDLGRLAALLDQQRPGLVEGTLESTLIAGGRSNLTFLVTDGVTEWVLRRPPLGHVLATAHDMSREYRVLTALRDTGVPVPQTVLLCQDEDVIGAPFYLMEKVEGTPYRSNEELQALGPERVRAIGERLVDTLAALHAVDYESVGLGDFGRPHGYLERQLRRWSTQLAASRSRELPGVDELQSRLAGRLPAEQPGAVVHGDYRLDNVLVDAGDRITAVLDWEMSTIGDPYADLGLYLVYQQIAPDAGFLVSERPPVGPTDEEILARYEAATGRSAPPLDYYVGFAYFKFAVILEGIHYRYVQGQTLGDGFAGLGDAVAPLVRSGLDALA